MKILCFGSCNTDYIYGVNKLVAKNETVTAKSLLTDYGGKGLNQAVALARAGAKVYFAACVGEDGDGFIDFLRKEGIDVSNVKHENCKTGHAFIQVESGGERSKVLFGGANEKVGKEFIDETLNRFGLNDVILLQNEISNVAYIIERAFARGMRVCLNPSPVDDEMRKVDLKKVDCLFVGEKEASEIFETEDETKIFEAVKSNYRNLKVLFTTKRKTCVYIDAESCDEYPVLDVETVDETASRDAFIGYYVADEVNGLSVDAAVRHACAAMIAAAGKSGSASSIPKREEVEKLTAKGVTLKKSKEFTGPEKIKAYIYDNCASVTLKDVADTLHYSVPYTVKWLSKNLGVTFGKLLGDARCSMAAELLLKSDMPVGDVIDKVGYQNESFFRKRFLKKYGVTPLQFRKTGGNVSKEINVINRKNVLMSFCLKEDCSTIIRTAAEDVNDAI